MIRSVDRDSRERSATFSFFIYFQNSTPHLSYVMSFLPLGRSSATLEYFHTVQPKPIRDARTEIVAMDLGNKYILQLL